MKYRWKKSENAWDDEVWRLYLILDQPEGGDMKYLSAMVTWYEHTETWDVFVVGSVSEEAVDIERTYELLCDAKEAVMNYMTVWWVTGAMQRMNDDERRQWRELVE